MCDVSPLFSTHIFNPYQQPSMQVCKYPDRTKARRHNLTSEAYVSSQPIAAQKPVPYDEDEENDARQNNPSWLQNQRGSAFGAGKRPSTDENTFVVTKKSKATSGSLAIGTTALQMERRVASLRFFLANSKPFSSVGNLRKPFKTPFKVPTLVLRENQPPPSFLEAAADSHAASGVDEELGPVDVEDADLDVSSKLPTASDQPCELINSKLEPC